MEAYTKLVTLALNRDTFVEILGPLEELMAREKSPQVAVVEQCGNMICLIMMACVQYIAGNNPHCDAVINCVNRTCNGYS